MVKKPQFSRVRFSGGRGDPDARDLFHANTGSYGHAWQVHRTYREDDLFA